MASNLVLGNVSGNSQDVSETSQVPEPPPATGISKCAFSSSEGEGEPAPALPAPQTSLDVNACPPEQLQKRRTSSRIIKRKKFDDELVESSLTKKPRTRARRAPLSMSLTKSVASVNGSRATQAMATFSNSSQAERNQAFDTKGFGKWKPVDDFALVLNVQQTKCLKTVFQNVKFSREFTLQEIIHRWWALLYDPAVSIPAQAAMKQLDHGVLAAIEARTMFSTAEEHLLLKFPSTSQPSLEQLQELLDTNLGTFRRHRTPEILLNHWLLMKQLLLLRDQAWLLFSDSDEESEDD